MRKFSRRPLLTGGVILSVVLVLAGGTAAIADVFDVTDYGAAGDGVTLDTAAINSAIEDCNAAGGGTVLFPAGTYLSGSIHLKSNVTLYIDTGATILGASNYIGAYDPAEDNPWDEYQDFGHSHWHNALMWGEGLENITITGPGTINGGGITTSNTVPAGGGDKAISLKLCDTILIEDVNIVQGGHFAILASGCENITINNVEIDTPRDGINLDCYTINAEITNCDVNAVRCEGGEPAGGDDAIGLKSSFAVGIKRLSENITIRDCVLRSGCNALQFGSETVGDFNNVNISNCTIWGAEKAGIGITTNDGAIISNVTYTNITMSKVTIPIHIKITDRGRAPGDPPVGKIQNITFNNITVTDVYGYIKDRKFTSTIDGKPGHPVENIDINDVSITYKGGGTKEQAGIIPPETDEYQPRKLGIRPSYGFYCRHAKGLKFRNVEVGFESDDLRPAILCDDVNGIELDNFSAEHAAGCDSIITLRNVKDFFMYDCPNLPPVESAYENAQVSESEVSVDELFSAGVDAVAAESGLGRASVFIDSELLESKYVWLNAGGPNNVSFYNLKIDTPGEHEVGFGGFGGDLDNDGDVALSDLGEFADDWLIGTFAAGDLDNDSDVDFLDFARFAGSWLAEALRLTVNVITVPLTDWTVYECSELPSYADPSWYEEQSTVGDGVAVLLSVIDDPCNPDNKLVKVYEPNGNYKELWAHNWGMVPATGATIVARVKALGSGYDRYFDISFRDGVYQERVEAYANTLALKYGGVSASVDTFEWHLYRITVKNDDVMVYQDEDSTVVIDGTDALSNPTSANFLRFGDALTPQTSGGLYDWIIWDTSGAYAPGEGEPIPSYLLTFE